MARTPAQRLSSLFHRSAVLDMDALERGLPGRSRRSLYRDLEGLGYLASYTHAGAYYALREGIPFDESGLWMRRGVGFSLHGTLKSTALHLVDVSASGRTHGELALTLQVRVHNTLLDLVHEGQLGRQDVGPTYLYVSAVASRAAAQVEERIRILRAAEPADARLASHVALEVLLELVRASKDLSFSVTGLTRRLLSRGVAVTPVQVEEVLHEHGIVKKGRHSRSRSSRR